MRDIRGDLQERAILVDEQIRAAEPKTYRVPRTFLERLKLWRRVYETKILSSGCEAFGRGPTPEASVETAKRWVSRQSAEKERGEAAG